MWLLLSWYLVFGHFFLNLRVMCSSLFWNSSSSPSPKLCPPDESSALLRFKNSFKTSSSVSCAIYDRSRIAWIESWKEGTDCCSWHGITCDRLTGHVIGIDLFFNGLHGSLHPNSSLFLLHHLQSLDLTCNDFIQSKISSNFSQLTKLTSLDLSYSNFEGSIPSSFWNLTGITHLRLSSNSFSGQVPASLSNFGNLKILYLDENRFSGVFPDVFGNLSKLEELFLPQNNFSGQLPSSIFNLRHVFFLYFSHNLFEGHFPSQASGLSNLTDLLLSDNLMNGRIPSWLFSLPSLIGLDLSNNNFFGPLPNSTTDIVLINQIDLSSNDISGIINPEFFSKFTNLFCIDLSYNSRLSLKANSSVDFYIDLSYFKMSSCNITKFPTFLRALQFLKYLDLSNNKISGEIFKRELEPLQNLFHLNLSHNFLTGIEEIPIMSLQTLDLRSNLLRKLIDLPPDISDVMFSNNRLVGEIPSSFCDFYMCHTLDLSNNSLSGIIPECLVTNVRLFLDLRMNNFHGSIPQTCRGSSLVSLNLNGNQLEGSLPLSLVDCSRLEVLDVGNNKINDTFPHWLGVLPKLQVLILRSNKFHGSIEESRTGNFFPNLRIVDISHNRFSGLLPTRFFEKFEAMMHGNENSVKTEITQVVTYYQYSVVLTVKGSEMEMQRALSIFTTIDLSSNQFQGQIPEIVGKLNSLMVLNFSRNNLTGQIPSSLKNLTQLESLDLSSNKLVGKIPTQLTSLTFLSVLNLSYNQLVGPIPQANQFGTFQNDSYVGNLGLCGLPLSEECSSDEAPEPTPTVFHKESHTSSWFDWKIVMMGYGSGLVIGLSMGYIVFSTGKPEWFVRLVERGQLKIVRRMNERRRGRRN